MTAITFQTRVQPWLLACFGAEIAADRSERNHRFLEESLELVQSCGCTASEAHQLVDYVFGRPVGEPAQEAGGVMVTLAALCLANSLDMHQAGETELARIWTKVEAIRAKQAAKPKHSPLPAAPAAAAPQGERQWICPTRTVADLANNLLTMDQALPIYGAQYIEKDGRRCAIAVPPTVSRERVKDGRWIGQGEELNAAVIWTRAERPAAMEGSAARKVFLVATGETSDGAETYTRHDDAPPPLCDAECLYTAPAAPALEAPAAPARIVADALIRLDAIYREEADCDEPPQRPDWLVNALHLAAAAPQAPAAPVPWLPYLSDRADGVKGRYAIARHNPAGYREVWNLRRHCWSAFSDEVLTMDEALAILQKLTMPTAAPAAPSALATQVIENLLQLARIVNTAVEDWGESFPDGSCEVKFHKDEADKMEAILEFFDGLPDAPEEEGVILSGPSRAARVLRAQAAPAAPAVDARAAIEKLPRYTYGYKEDDWGMNRHLTSYKSEDGKFLLRDDVLSAIAAQAAAKGA